MAKSVVKSKPKAAAKKPAAKKPAAAAAKAATSKKGSRRSEEGAGKEACRRSDEGCSSKEVCAGKKSRTEGQSQRQVSLHFICPAIGVHRRTNGRAFFVSGTAYRLRALRAA